MKRSIINERTREFVVLLVRAGFTPAEAGRVLRRAGLPLSTASVYRIAADANEQPKRQVTA